MWSKLYLPVRIARSWRGHDGRFLENHPSPFPSWPRRSERSDAPGIRRPSTTGPSAGAGRWSIGPFLRHRLCAPAPVLPGVVDGRPVPAAYGARGWRGHDGGFLEKLSPPPFAGVTLAPSRLHVGAPTGGVLTWWPRVAGPRRATQAVSWSVYAVTTPIAPMVGSASKSGAVG